MLPAAAPHAQDRAGPRGPVGVGGRGAIDPVGEFAELDVVDADLLVPPPEAIRGSWRSDAAVVLDRELVNLSGMHARCRTVQARLARRLCDFRGWRRLGFVRLVDYAEERLGLAARTLEEDARVVRALDDLPATTAALESGALAWTRARALVRVATPGNEVVLLRESAGVPLRELEAFLRGFATPGATANACACGAGSSASEDAGTASASRPLLAGANACGCETSASHAEGAGEPSASRPLLASANVCGSAIRGVGPRSTAGPAGEDEWGKDAGSANACGSVPAPAHGEPSDEQEPALRWSITVSRSGRRLWRAAREYASRSAGTPLSPGRVLELVAAESATSPGGGRWSPGPDFHERRLRARMATRERSARHAILAFLAETGAAEGFDWLAPASREPGPAAVLDGLLEGLDGADAFELDRRLRTVRRAAQRIDFQMAALLHIGIHRRLFRELGFATVKLYVESRLGCSARTVWSMVEVVRGSWRHSRLLREAWRDGHVSHLAARLLLDVIDERSASAWIERARAVTLRRLRDEVAWALERAGGRRGEGWPPEAGTDVRAEATGDVTVDEVRTRAHGESPDPSLGPPGAVRVECTVPLSVAVLVEDTLDRLQRPREARWQAFERMLALALLEWTSQPCHRDPVFERDGWRCTVPGCTSRRNLHDHHLLFRSRGGGNRRDNRTTVCAAHHLHGIHEGIVRAWGEAPGDITWELGCREGAEPLLRLVGERYAWSATQTALVCV